MADKYWYVANNGSASWSTGANWYDVSGGPPNGGITVGAPTVDDYAILDEQSGSGTITITSNASTCFTLFCPNFLGTLAGTATLTIASELYFGSQFTLTYSGLLNFGSASYPGMYNILDFVNRTILGNVTFNQSSSTWVVSDFRTVSTSTVTLTSGELATSSNYNTYGLECGIFLSGGNAVRTIWGSNTSNFNWNITGIGTVWNVSGTNIICGDGSSPYGELIFTNSTNNTKTITHGVAFPNVPITTFLGGTGDGPFFISGNFYDFYVQNTAGARVSFGTTIISGTYFDFFNSNVNWNNATSITITFSNTSNDVYISLSPNMTITNSGSIILTGSNDSGTGFNTTSNGKILTGNFTINAGYLYNYDTLYTNGVLTLNSGNINSGGAISCASLSTSNTNPRTVSLSSLYLTGTGTILSVSTQTNLTFEVSDIYLTSNVSLAKTVSLAGVVSCYNLILQGSGTALTTITAGITVNIYPSITISKTGGTLSIGTSYITDLTFIQGSTIAWQATSTLTIYGNVTLCNSMSIITSNPLTFVGGVLGNNQTLTTSNKTFTGPLNVLDPSGSNNTTLTVYGNYISNYSSGAAINITSAYSVGFVNSIQISTNISINGSASGGSLYIFINSITQATTLSITSASVTLGSTTLSGGLTLSSGDLSFTTNSIYNILTFTSSSSTLVRNINLGINTIINLTGSVANTWNTSQGLSQGVLSLTPGTSTINIIDTTGASVSFQGGGCNYYNLNINRGNLISNSPTTIFTGSNLFQNFKDLTKTQSGFYHQIQFASSTTTIILDTFQVGNTGNITYLYSSSASVFFNLQKSNNGLVICPNVYIQLSNATPSNTWYAISNSSNAGTTGWIFNTPPRRLGVGGAG